jgi:hypothetical protein
MRGFAQNDRLSFEDNKMYYSPSWHTRLRQSTLSFLVTTTASSLSDRRNGQGESWFAHVCNALNSTGYPLRCAVGMLGRFSDDSSLEHWNTALYVLKYLKHTRTSGSCSRTVRLSSMDFVMLNSQRAIPLDFTSPAAMFSGLGEEPSTGNPRDSLLSRSQQEIE